MKLNEKVSIELINIEIAPESVTRQESLNLMGQRNPIRLRKNGNRFDIVDGRRRLTDLIKVGNKTVQALIFEEKELDDEALHADALILNSGTSNPLDEGRHIIWLKTQKGWSDEDVAATSNFSVSKIINLVALVERLLPQYQELLARGDIKVTAAYELVKCPTKTQQEIFDRGERGVKGITQAVKKYRKDTFLAGLHPLTLETIDTETNSNAQAMLNGKPKQDTLNDTNGPGVFIPFSEVNKLNEGRVIDVKFKDTNITIESVNTKKVRDALSEQLLVNPNNDKSLSVTIPPDDVKNLVYGATVEVTVRGKVYNVRFEAKQIQVVNGRGKQ